MVEPHGGPHLASGGRGICRNRRTLAKPPPCRVSTISPTGSALGCRWSRRPRPSTPATGSDWPAATVAARPFAHRGSAEPRKQICEIAAFPTAPDCERVHSKSAIFLRHLSRVLGVWHADGGLSEVFQTRLHRIERIATTLKCETRNGGTSERSRRVSSKMAVW